MVLYGMNLASNSSKKHTEKAPYSMPNSYLFGANKVLFLIHILVGSIQKICLLTNKDMTLGNIYLDLKIVISWYNKNINLNVKKLLMKDLIFYNDLEHFLGQNSAS